MNDIVNKLMANKYLNPFLTPYNIRFGPDFPIRIVLLLVSFYLLFTACGVPFTAHGAFAAVIGFSLGEVILLVAYRGRIGK